MTESNGKAEWRENLPEEEEEILSIDGVHLKESGRPSCWVGVKSRIAIIKC